MGVGVGVGVGVGRVNAQLISTFVPSGTEFRVTRCGPRCSTGSSGSTGCGSGGGTAATGVPTGVTSIFTSSPLTSIGEMSPTGAPCSSSFLTCAIPASAAYNSCRASASSPPARSRPGGIAQQADDDHRADGDDDEHQRQDEAGLARPQAWDFGELSRQGRESPKSHRSLTVAIDAALVTRKRRLRGEARKARGLRSRGRRPCRNTRARSVRRRPLRYEVRKGRRPVDTRRDRI